MTEKDSRRTQTITQEDSQKLMEYMDKYGFRYKGECYFVATWIPEARRRRLIDVKKIIRVGTRSELIKQDIPIPPRYHSNFVYYRVNDLSVIL